MAGLESLRTPDEVAKLRGLTVDEVLGLTGEKRDGSATNGNGNGAAAESAAPGEAAAAAAADSAAPDEAAAAAADEASA